MEDVSDACVHRGHCFGRGVCKHFQRIESSCRMRAFVSAILLQLFVVAWVLSGQAAAATSEQLPRSDAASQATAIHPPRIEPFLAVASFSFEQNKGQFDDAVKYLARGNGQTVFIAADGMHLALESRASDGAKSERSIVRIQFDAAAGSTDVLGLDRLEAITNYFLGSSPITNVPNYARVRHLDVYPGIDVIYYGSQGRLEYDFMVFPGASVESIKLRVSGHRQASISAGGDLVLTTSLGDVTFQKPLGYQDIDGARIDVPVKYLLSGNHVMFEPGAFDRTRPLVIDPILSYSTYVTGSGDHRAGGIVLDKNGNAFITGDTTSTDFPRVGPFQNSRKGYPDAFVSKLNANGSGLIYSTYLGGRQGETYGRGIAIDAQGNAYVTGTTSSTSFPTTSGAYRTSIGANSGFVAKLNAQGNALVYSTYVPGGEAAAIAVDGQGNAYISGTAYGNFTTTPGVLRTSAPAAKSAFVAKLNATGSTMIYASYLGGSSGEQYASGIAIDTAGYAYVTGRTSASDFPTVNPIQPSLAGRFDAFLTKFNPNATGLIYSTYLGGTLDDYAYSVAVDSQGNAHVAGSTYSLDFPVRRAFQSTKGYTGSGHALLNNAFITKLSANGDSLLYSTYLGGSGCLGPGVNVCQVDPYGHEEARAITLDAVGNAYLAGTARSLGLFQRDPIQTTLSPYGSSTPFVAKIQDLGVGQAALRYFAVLGRRLNTSDDMAAAGIAVDAAGNAYAVGHVVNYPEGGFPVTAGAYQTSSQQYSNVNRIVVFKLSPGRFTTSIATSTFQPTDAAPVTLTATVTSAVPGGMVTFANNGVTLGTAAMSQGLASITTSLPVGIHRLTATYSGDNKISPPLFLPVSRALVCN